jgi:hypothetical protein
MDRLDVGVGQLKALDLDLGDRWAGRCASSPKPTPPGKLSGDASSSSAAAGKEQSQLSLPITCPRGLAHLQNPQPTLLPWQSAGPAFQSAAAGEGVGRGHLFLVHDIPCYTSGRASFPRLTPSGNPTSRASSTVLPRQHACPLPPPRTLCPTFTPPSAGNSEEQGQLAYSHDLGPALLPAIGGKGWHLSLAHTTTQHTKPWGQLSHTHALGTGSPTTPATRPALLCFLGEVWGTLKSPDAGKGWGWLSCCHG